MICNRVGSSDVIFNLFYVLMVDSNVFLFALLRSIVVDAAHFTFVNTSSGIVTGHSALYGGVIQKSLPPREFCHFRREAELIAGDRFLLDGFRSSTTWARFVTFASSLVAEIFRLE
jgi:hypothetical protein